MRILGIDTAIPTASVALIQDGELLAEEIHHGQSSATTAPGLQPIGNHAEVVLPLIESVFEKAQITVQQLSGIAVSIGPGSFTGLRIGLATAKGSPTSRDCRSSAFRLCTPSRARERLRRRYCLTARRAQERSLPGAFSA